MTIQSESTSTSMYKSVVYSLFASCVFATSDIPSCGAGLPDCPEKYPCCSADGTCGNGYVCLSGCDPRYSYEPGACVAMPIFENGYNYTFESTDGVVPYAKYFGDAEKMPWNYYGNVTAVDNKLRAQLFKGGPATVVSSGYYLWYGKVTIRMRSSRGAGIVSDFIVLSGTKDEIDYELIGNNLKQAQSNYYWQGILDYKNMIGEAVSSDTQANFHEYTLDWHEDHIDWIIDGNTMRTLKKSDTKNETTGEYMYPQTPARVQFGLWPGGDSSSEGTAEWAGGKVDWDAADIKDPGYFYVEVDSVSVQTYDAPSGTNSTGSKSYVFTKKNGFADSVAITDDDYILGSTDGTGLQLDGSLTNKTNTSIHSNISSGLSRSTMMSSNFNRSLLASSTGGMFNSTAISSGLGNSSITARPSMSSRAPMLNSTTISRQSSTIISMMNSTMASMASVANSTMRSFINSTVASNGTSATTTGGNSIGISLQEPTQTSEQNPSIDSASLEESHTGTGTKETSSETTHEKHTDGSTTATPTRTGSVRASGSSTHSNILPSNAADRIIAPAVALLIPLLF